MNDETPPPADAVDESAAPASPVDEATPAGADAAPPADEAAPTGDVPPPGAASEAAPADVGDIAEVKGILEAALLVSGEAVTVAELGKLFDPPLPADTVRKLLDALREDWQGRKVELVQVASGWRFQGVPAVQPYLARLSPEKPPRYSRAIMETLAIIAYQQPVTRGDIESIRGVAVSTNVITTLVDRQWVEIVGHRETPGRPALYATTKVFLDDLGLRSLAELPPLAELDTTHLLEMPDAPTKAAEAALVLATPLLGPEPDEAAEPRADRDPGEPPAGEDQTIH